MTTEEIVTPQLLCPICFRPLVPDEIGDAFCGCGNRITYSFGYVIGTKPLPDGWQTAYKDVMQNSVM